MYLIKPVEITTDNVVSLTADMPLSNAVLPEMFDASNSTQTVGAEGIMCTIQMQIYFDVVAFFGVQATTVCIEQTNADGQTATVNSMQLLSHSRVSDWLTWFTAKPLNISCLVLPLNYFNGTTITLNFYGVNAKVGACIIGTSTRLGVTRTGTRLGLLDYSRKTTNDFGVTTLVKRSYSRKIDATFEVQAESHEQVLKNLANLRATPVVLIADNSLSTAPPSRIVYGFIKDWAVEVAYVNANVFSLSFEELA